MKVLILTIQFRSLNSTSENQLFLNHERSERCALTEASQTGNTTTLEIQALLLLIFFVFACYKQNKHTNEMTFCLEICLPSNLANLCFH